MATMPRQRKLLTRSRSDRILGGVCAGLAGHFDIDPLVVRLAFVGLALIDGIGILLYALLWLLVPAEGAPATPAPSGQGG